MISPIRVRYTSGNLWRRWIGCEQRKNLWNIIFDIELFIKRIKINLIVNWHSVEVLPHQDSSFVFRERDIYA